jgi:SAM-dependent methyltransferase
MSAVESQYTKWVYPIPIEDMRGAIANGTYWEIGDPLLYHPVFWPYKRDIEKLDILIAGCGSVQAAYYACRNPNWNVIGVDLSESSLAHQQKLKERHGLSNLRLKKLDLTKVKTLGEDFDFVVSTGVLHHLPDPDAGLAALKEILRPDGVMNLMVYGQSLRLGVYMMQEVFKLLGFGQSQKDVDIVKSTITDLSPDHVLNRYIKSAPDLHYDAAYVDTFLHPQDRAYYVNQVFEFTRKAGLEFLGWCDPAEYSLEINVPKNHPLWNKINNISPEVAAHVCDLLTQNRGTHRWAAAHPQYTKKAQIPFKTDKLFDCCIALHRHATLRQEKDSAGRNIYYCRRGNTSWEIHPAVHDIISQSSGAIKIGQILREARASNVLVDDITDIVNEQLESLLAQGKIHIFLPAETV